MILRHWWNPVIVTFYCISVGKVHKKSLLCNVILSTILRISFVAKKGNCIYATFSVVLVLVVFNRLLLWDNGRSLIFFDWAPAGRFTKNNLDVFAKCKRTDYASIKFIGEEMIVQHKKYVCLISLHT